MFLSAFETTGAAPLLADGALADPEENEGQIASVEAFLPFL